MEKHEEVTWRHYILYFLVFIFVILANNAFGQMKAIHFNADWNKSNDVSWFNKLTDVKKSSMDVGKGDCQKKYKIAVVPSIIIFDDGEEVARFQADLSFKMLATRKEIQDFIDELLMSKF